MAIWIRGEDGIGKSPVEGGVLFKGEPLVYTKLEMLVSAISPRYKPRSRLLFTEELHGSLRLSYLVGSTA